VEEAAVSRKGKLHCYKFDRWMDIKDAICPRPEDYCDKREKCAVYFLMTENIGTIKKKRGG
jgi:hypothetical protein